ncbi:MAG TPA: helix-turn-helix transcriptional regulator [Pirellulales bacterium]|nr:helix-turn-helix transcriptional regulator [Pirellulales bacterium]
MKALQRLEVAGKRFVLLEESEYQRLCQVAGQVAETADDLPALPKPNKKGQFPALEYARISLARDLIRNRKELGLSRQRLAELARIRPDTLARVESGKHTAAKGIVDKIMRAIESERRHAKRQRRQPSGR